MIVFDYPRDIHAYAGKELGVSEWLTIDQDRLNLFAEATGDHQWIHVDVERASKEMPDGKTIAHGFLTLSLIPVLSSEIYSIKNKSRGINYGLNKVRFTGMVPVGSRVRLRQSCKQVEDVEPEGVRVYWENTVEIEGQERPACVAESISIAYA